MKKQKCKFPDTSCHYQYDDPHSNLCWKSEGCLFAVYPPEDEEWNFQTTLEKSPYWTLWGCDSPSRSIIDDTILRFIQNIAGDVTEPNSGIYKHPDAMFNALDLIYSILEDTREGPIKVQKLQHGTDEMLTWHLGKTEKISQRSEGDTP